MKINVGVLDRIFRMILAVATFAAGSLLVNGYARLALYVLSLSMVVTSTTGFCFLYQYGRLLVLDGMDFLFWFRLQ